MGEVSMWSCLGLMAAAQHDTALDRLEAAAAEAAASPAADTPLLQLLRAR
eukprot:CAMPEP_0202881952 /NCGR_PEP_ID=MMETSP1391-20130828/37284_1 /ASSEMBLY_ACC=CAM_ASM_000867 /TAXON_ID=1034604 /ORGANISM="Chlamydomonas leiostraca, Strain SAG 11-49" /LENGTH=49 /DNA_ID= /DNA_START= /DNA_END= /DNA_ORIENTATION=